jgi:hypothetical protein
VLVAYLELFFVGHQAAGVAEMFDEIVNEMLANPLLGGQCNIFAAENVENSKTTADLLHLYFVSREV